MSSSIATPCTGRLQLKYLFIFYSSHYINSRGYLRICYVKVNIKSKSKHRQCFQRTDNGQKCKNETKRNAKTITGPVIVIKYQVSSSLHDYHGVILR